jgi:hypothetical protein
MIILLLCKRAIVEPIVRFSAKAVYTRQNPESAARSIGSRDRR